MKSYSFQETNDNKQPAAVRNNMPQPVLQAKLEVGQPGDKYEQQADAVADKVMQMPQQNFLQRKCGDCKKDEKNQSPQKPLNDSVTSVIQTKSENSNSVSDSVSQSVQSSKGAGSPLDLNTQSFMSSRFGTDFSNVKIHTGNETTQMNRRLNAKAFTAGNDIYFNEGQYQPNSATGKHLLAHELTHVVQQSNSAEVIQRDDDVINMPAETITVGMPDVSSLSTPVAANAVSIGWDQATIELNSQLPNTRLPFTASGWNGNEIAAKLGQYDRIPGTDSDAVRCVQAVALMSYILMGPAAATSYLTSVSMQGLIQAAGHVGTRERAAMRVIDFVKGQIENRQATYGNMYWAMEAVHDLFYADDKGTPAANANTVRSQITPMMDFSQNMVNMDVWCNNRTELMAQAATLNSGEQLMLNTWKVSFNSVFDDIGVPTTQQTATYTQTNEEGRNARSVSIRRIDASHKPTPNQIDKNRDSKSGHQMLIFKDATDNHIKMYEPEVTTTGNHLSDLTTNPSVIDTELFFDQPKFELYKYAQIWGKIVPSPTTFPANF